MADTLNPKMKLKPLNDCVLVEEEPFKPYNEYVGLKHIIVPDKFEHGPKDRTPWGKVLAFGDTCRRTVRKGNRVCWGKFAGIRFEQRNRVIVLVREDELLAVDDKS